MAKEQQVAAVAWEGDSREVVRTFPDGIKEELGLDIWRMQRGERPLNARPMKSIGPGVFELRQMDEAGWYRLIYLSKVGNTLHMLHAFIKKSASTSRNDLNIATNRLKVVKDRLREEKKNARKEK